MKQKDNEYEERRKFLQVYTDFNDWLSKLGFECDNTYNSTALDYHYSWYDDKLESLCSVEHYINEKLKMSIRFLRGRNEHKFMIVGELGASSELITIDEFKELLKQEVIKLRDEKLAELQFFNWL